MLHSPGPLHVVTPRESADPPEWVRSAVVYEVNLRAFSAHGLRGVTEKLAYIQQLGATVVWLMPFHPVGLAGRKGPLGSPYAVRDYYAVDPALGTLADLHELIAEARRLGLRTVYDLVANHTALDSVLAGSHPEYFRRDAAGVPMSSEPAWSDVAALDYSRREVREYMLGVMSHWVREFGFDGMRCDVAHYVPRDFWEEARERLGPEVLLIAESEDPALVSRRGFDAGYAWQFFHAMNSVFTEGAPATRMREVWRQRRQALPEGALELRFTDNHDESRAIVRWGERAALAASALVFLLDGIPLLYNGQEIGDTAESGPPALFDRVPVDWGNAERRPGFARFFRQLIHLRRAHSALRQGDVIWASNSDPGRIVSFFRDGDNQEFLCAVNCSNRPFEGHVDGGMGRVVLGPHGVLVCERTWGRMLDSHPRTPSQSY